MKHLAKFFTYWCLHDYLQDVVLSVAGGGGGREGERGGKGRGERGEENTEKHCNGELKNLGASPTGRASAFCEGGLGSSYLSQDFSTVHNLEAEWFLLCNSWGLMN